MSRVDQTVYDHDLNRPVFSVHKKQNILVTYDFRDRRGQIVILVQVHTIYFTLQKAKDLLLIRKFVLRMKGIKSKIVMVKFSEKQQITGLS